jgi:hypothetical protein
MAERGPTQLHDGTFGVAHSDDRPLSDLVHEVFNCPQGDFPVHIPQNSCKQTISIAEIPIDVGD